MRADTSGTNAETGSDAGSAATYTVTTLARIADVPASQWDTLAGEDYPFTRHAFLDALERHGCVGEQVGWIPSHILVHEGDRLVGATPAYVKLHSQGEFVFDWSWAEAYSRHGLEYYPKLVSAIPFTPSTGPRLLVHPAARTPEVKHALAAGAVEVSKAMNASSFHWLFPRESDAAALESGGLLMRSGCQFHWMNRGYRDFQDYLDAMTSKRRKEIRRERRDAASAPVDIEIHDGRTATEAQWHAYHALYSSTYDRKWGYPRTDPVVLHQRGGIAAGPHAGGARKPRRALRRRRPLLRGTRHPLRAQLGLYRALPRAALRDLLLPADRALHPPRTGPVRRRRPGRAQAPARIPAGRDPFRALDPRPPLSRRHRPVSRRGAKRPAALSPRDGDPLALPRGRRRGSPASGRGSSRTTASGVEAEPRETEPGARGS